MRYCSLTETERLFVFFFFPRESKYLLEVGGGNKKIKFPQSTHSGSVLS